MLTVLLATRNGGSTLAGVLQAYCELESPPGGYKIVVVDNGSTDDTPALAQRFKDRLPLTWMSETRPGKNAALNTGLSAVEGDLVVLTDDDAFPHPDLLLRYRDAVDSNPGYSIFGGAIVPRWQETPPDWLRWVPRGPVFSLTPALASGPTASHNVFGPNMAIRARLFDGGTRFNTSIGPRGANYAMGSETELVRRLIRNGNAAWHAAEAVVEHFVRSWQMQRASVLARAVRFGRGQFRLASLDGAPPAAAWGGVPRHLVRSLGEQAARVARAYVRRDAEALFHARWNLNYEWGQAVEARAMHNESKKG